MQFPLELMSINNTFYFSFRSLFMFEKFLKSSLNCNNPWRMLLFSCFKYSRFRCGIDICVPRPSPYEDDCQLIFIKWVPGIYWPRWKKKGNREWVSRGCWIGNGEAKPVPQEFKKRDLREDYGNFLRKRRFSIGGSGKKTKRQKIFRERAEQSCSACSNEYDKACLVLTLCCFQNSETRHLDMKLCKRDLSANGRDPANVNE